MISKSSVRSRKKMFLQDTTCIIIYVNNFVMPQNICLHYYFQTINNGLFLSNMKSQFRNHCASVFMVWQVNAHYSIALMWPVLSIRPHHTTTRFASCTVHTYRAGIKKSLHDSKLSGKLTQLASRRALRGAGMPGCRDTRRAEVAGGEWRARRR